MNVKFTELLWWYGLFYVCKSEGNLRHSGLALDPMRFPSKTIMTMSRLYITIDKFTIIHQCPSVLRQQMWAPTLRVSIYAHLKKGTFL